MLLFSVLPKFPVIIWCFIFRARMRPNAHVSWQFVLGNLKKVRAAWFWIKTKRYDDVMGRGAEILSSWLKDKRLKPLELGRCNAMQCNAGQCNAMQWGSEGLISIRSAPFRCARPKCPNFHPQDEKTRSKGILRMHNKRERTSWEDEELGLLRGLLSSAQFSQWSWESLISIFTIVGSVESMGLQIFHWHIAGMLMKI